MLRSSDAAADRRDDPAWAWAAYVPDAARPWDRARAAHLYRRAGFGASWQELETALAAGPDRTIERLVRPEANVAAYNREQDEYAAAATGDLGALRAWWLRRMMETPQPLLEKMTFFWHNHFAIRSASVPSGMLVERYLAILRTHALGRFDALLKALLKDPAFLLGLGAESNRKAQPDDDFARMFLEDFTVGPDAFQERDVRAVARAFTGPRVLRGELRYFEHEHDAEPKTFLGQTGNWAADDICRIALAQPAAAQHLVRRLYRWLISETDEPDAALVAPLAADFAKDYDIARVVETMLRSNLFFSPAAYRRRVKGPVQYALGIVRALESSVPTARLAADAAELGQTLYTPPTVKGWPGGETWLTSITLLGRSRLAGALIAPEGPYGGRLDPVAVAKKHGHETASDAAAFFLDLLVQGDVAPEARAAIVDAAPASDLAAACRQAVHAIAMLPEFQLD